MRTEAFPIEPGAARRRRASRPRVGRFEGVAVGPLQLRAALRDRCEPGERLMGFALGRRATTSLDAARGLAVGVIPGVGQLLLLVDSARHQAGQKLYVLTDRRLLVLHADRRLRKVEKAIVAEAPVERLRVRALDRRGRRVAPGAIVRLGEPPMRFEVEAEDLGLRRIQFRKGRRRRAERRLRQALWALSS